MSNYRNEILPGAGIWDCFYDRKVQAVLATRRHIVDAKDDYSKEERLEFLAWPIIAFCEVDEIVQDSGRAVRHEQFLRAYAEDPPFVARLLLAVCDYHFLPERDKTLARRVAEVSNVSTPEYMETVASGRTVVPDNSPKSGDSKSIWLGLEDWKTIAKGLGCANSTSQIRTEFYREKRRRRIVVEPWADNLSAWNELQTLRSMRPLLPLQHVSVRQKDE